MEVISVATWFIRVPFVKVCIYGRVFFVFVFLNALNVFLSVSFSAHWAFGLFSI